MAMPDFEYEKLHGAFEGKPIAGVDEVGRGPWAGPVVAAAAIVDPRTFPQSLRIELDDSKKLSAKRRERLFPEILKHARVAVAEASVAEIDSMNILAASMLAMRRAISQLGIVPVHILVDGNRIPDDLPCPATPVVKGDGRCISIAAASIVAKVTRDRLMADLAKEYPHFGWEKNAGYGTAAHIEGLKKAGPTPHHRTSFAPIRSLLEGG